MLDINDQIKKLYPIEMASKNNVTIQFITGFELQNTRPYHNYETWSQEWRIFEGDNFYTSKVKACAEHLNDAIALFVAKKTKVEKIEIAR